MDDWTVVDQRVRYALEGNDATVSFRRARRYSYKLHLQGASIASWAVW